VKKYFFFLIIILFLLFSSLSVNAIKISYKGFDRIIYFEPNLHKELIFTISDAEKVAKVPIELKGKFAKYAVVTPSVFSLRPGEKKDITLTLDLPEKIPKGIHILNIAAIEKPAVTQKGAFVLMPAVGVALKIVNTDVQQTCSMASFNAGITKKEVNIVLNAANNGLSEIKDAYADFTLYDSEDKIVTTFSTDKFSIDPFESFTARTSEELNNAVEGYYTIKGTLYCAGKKFPITKQILNHATDITIHNFNVYKKEGYFFAEFDVENKFLAPIKTSGVFGFYEDKKLIHQQLSEKS